MGWSDCLVFLRLCSSQHRNQQLICSNFYHHEIDASPIDSSQVWRSWILTYKIGENFYNRIKYWDWYFCFEFLLYHQIEISHLRHAAFTTCCRKSSSNGMPNSSKCRFIFSNDDVDSLSIESSIRFNSSFQSSELIIVCLIIAKCQ